MSAGPLTTVAADLSETMKQVLLPHLTQHLSRICRLIPFHFFRYIAVSRPLNVFVRTKEELRWCKVWLYVGPVLAFSLLFNVPTFLEFYVTYDEPDPADAGQLKKELKQTL